MGKLDIPQQRLDFGLFFVILNEDANSRPKCNTLTPPILPVVEARLVESGIASDQKPVSATAEYSQSLDLSPDVEGDPVNVGAAEDDQFLAGILASTVNCALKPLGGFHKNW